MNPFVTYADVAPHHVLKIIENNLASTIGFMGRKITSLSTVIQSYISSFTHQVTSFASAYPVLTSVALTSVLLVLALKVALITFKCLDKCSTFNKQKQEAETKPIHLQTQQA